MTDDAPREHEPSAEDPVMRFLLQIDPDRIDDSIKELSRRLRELVETHRWSKVRLTYKGRPLMPDIPLAVFVAGQAASLWWTGPLRVLLLNLGLGAMLGVQLIHEADERTAEGRALYEDGDIEAAEARYREALKMRPGDPAALTNLGILLRVTGRQEEAIEALSRAAARTEHPEAERARKVLARMGIRTADAVD